ncbi:MAG: hypothetical protein LW865_16240 [Betaproteobacteria bacterium]|nr:hypothetical protein [Betaproteobacteria bacterium]
MHVITLTGADERTSVTVLQALVASYPSVEIGLLYTATPEGRNRYPPLDWLHATAEALTQRVAIHICGRTARQQLLDGKLAGLVSHARRVQVNGQLSVEELQACASRVPHLITQHNATTRELASVPIATHSLLVDASGGKGLSPQYWQRPADAGSKPVGYAGGLGPDNLATQLDQIAYVAGESAGQAWVDMEGKLRDESDWFDLDRAARCAQIFEAWRKEPIDR